MQPQEKSNIILRPRAKGQSALSSRSSSRLPAVLTQDGTEPQIFEKNSRPRLSFDTALQTPSHSVNEIPALIPISVLYIFSGVERRADVGQYLREHPLIAGTISEVDVLRDPEAGDVTVKAVWNKLMSDLSCGVYDVLIITPPCNSFSRATWAIPNLADQNHTQRGSLGRVARIVKEPGWEISSWNSLCKPLKWHILQGRFSCWNIRRT